VSNFDLGIGEAEELFKGLGTYTEPAANYLRAVHDYNVAVAALSKAVGRSWRDWSIEKVVDGCPTCVGARDAVVMQFSPRRPF